MTTGSTPPKIKPPQMNATTAESPKCASLRVIGAILLVIVIAFPFIIWTLSSPSHFSSFSAGSDRIVQLYSGKLISKQSAQLYEKYSNPDAAAGVLEESKVYSEGKQSIHSSRYSTKRTFMSYHADSSGIHHSHLKDPFWGDGHDEFSNFPDNEFKRVEEEPVSTFSADVDTSSYSYVRRTLNDESLPQSDAVKVEEMINYFEYDYPLPKKIYQPFNATVGVSNTPWAKGRKLVHIGVKGYDMQSSERRFSNLVFLIDVSGSMYDEDRLPLVKSSIELLLPSLDPEDSVAIVSYANTVRVVLGPTPAAQKGKILKKLRQLQAGGGTGGAGGLELAYKMAEKNYDKDAVNRIILATDGDFNVGPTDNDVLQKFVESKREKGIYLSILGYGMGNYKDSRMKALANHGNGVASYIDTLQEAKKILVDESSSTLFPIANDVKLQVEFNPEAVSDYRLIGYEKRLLNREDFNNDKVDAGDVGSGHTVTAIYEITPKESTATPAVDELRYSKKGEAVENEEGNEAVVKESKINSDEYAFLKIRYKLPGEEESKLLSMPILASDAIQSLSGRFSHDTHSLLPDEQSTRVGREFEFATAVAGFAQLLRDGKHISNFGFDEVVALAEASKGGDEHGYRREFIELVHKAKKISNRKCWRGGYGGDGEVEKCEW